MKNKIMTKALAVVLSASMALSLSSAMSLSTVEAATAPAFASAKFKVKEGESKNFKLNVKSRKAGWKIVSQSVAKKTKVTAKVNSSKKSIKLTGAENYEWPSETSTQAGTKIRVRVRKNGKKTTDQILKVNCYLKRNTAEVATVNLTSAKLVSFDTAVLTFDGEYTLPTETGVEAVTINGSEKAATAVTIAADKLSATVTYGFAENTEYTFAIEGAAGTQSFTVGSFAVVSLSAPESKSVSAGEEQTIEYKLLAENDVDVTAYSNYTDYVTINIDGDRTDSSEDPVKPWIEFDAEGQKATVKFTYNDTVNPELTAQTIYTATKAVATEATARWSNDYLKKWHIVDTTDESMNMFNGDTRRLFFYAKKEDGSAVVFSNIDVKSSNTSVVDEPSWELSENGKWAVLTFTAAGNGNATITIVGEEYKGTETVSKEYTYPVKVTEFNNNISTFNTTVTSATLYNGGYNNQVKIGLEAKNSLGDFVDASYSVTVTKGSGDVTTDLVEGKWLWSTDDDSTTTINKATVDAYANNIVFNAKYLDAGAYKLTIVATGESGSNTKDIKKTVNIRVNDVLSSLYSDEYYTEVKESISGTFKVETNDIEVGDNTINATNDGGKIMLVAYVSGKPIGYVDSLDGIMGLDDGYEILQKMLASVTKDTWYTISGDNLKYYVSMGNTYFTDHEGTVSGDYYAVSSNAVVTCSRTYLGNNVGDNPGDGVTKKSAIGNVVYTQYDNNLNSYVDYSVRVMPNAIDYDDDFWFFSSTSNKNVGLAKAGTYNVVFYYGGDDAFHNGGGKQIGSTGKFKVSYSFTIPTIEYNPSATNAEYAVSSVQVIRNDDAIDGLAVDTAITAADGKNPVTTAFSKAKDNTDISKGDKIKAVAVSVLCGGYWNGDDTDYDEAYEDWTLDHGLHLYVWSQWRGYKTIHFVIEKNQTITA